MKRFLLPISLLAMNSLLTSCGAIADSLVNSMLGIDDDDEVTYRESREKQERRAYYRTEGKPTIQ